jgi:hypothetical protein
LSLTIKSFVVFSEGDDRMIRSDSWCRCKRFLWLFHNKVNKNTRSKEFSLEETTAIYSRAITSHIVKNFIDVMNIKTPDLKLTLIKNQSKNVYMPSFHEYINNNYYKFN